MSIVKWCSLSVTKISNNKNVISVAKSAFRNKSDITSVKIESGISEIGSLCFMSCSSLEKVTIPKTVTSIGANAFYGCSENLTICCERGSTAHEYALSNNIQCEFFDITEIPGTSIDYENKLIFTNIHNAKDISDIIGIPSLSDAIAQGGYYSGKHECLGTGTVVTVFENNNYTGDYDVIVTGDLDGDSVCDVIDVLLTENCMNGQNFAKKSQIYAANGKISDEIDITSYQNTVNTALNS